MLVYGRAARNLFRWSNRAPATKPTSAWVRSRAPPEKFCTLQWDVLALKGHVSEELVRTLIQWVLVMEDDTPPRSPEPGRCGAPCLRP